MESEAVKKWRKENTRTIAAKLTNKYDQDIIDYLKDKRSVSDVIKKALRLMIAAETGKDNAK